MIDGARTKQANVATPGVEDEKTVETTLALSEEKIQHALGGAQKMVQTALAQSKAAEQRARKVMEDSLAPTLTKLWAELQAQPPLAQTPLPTQDITSNFTRPPCARTSLLELLKIFQPGRTYKERESDATAVAEALRILDYSTIPDNLREHVPQDWVCLRSAAQRTNPCYCKRENHTYCVKVRKEEQGYHFKVVDNLTTGTGTGKRRRQ